MKIQLRRDTFNNIQANIANAAMYVSPGELFLETSNGILKTSTTHLTGNTDWNSFTTVGPKNRFTNSNSSIVGTTDNQTLTNKTFTSPPISGSNTFISSFNANVVITTLNLTTANVITLNTTTLLANVGAGFQNMEVITTTGTGTWTLPAALQRIGSEFKVTLVGGGGAGGRPTVDGNMGAGGGSGAVVVGFYIVSNTQNTTMSYGIGTAGVGGNPATNGQPSNTSYDGITFSATGGVGAPNGLANGAAGGTATGGTLNFNGFTGSSGTGTGLTSATNQVMGRGADTPLGFGQGGSPAGATNTVGGAGSGYGSGGAGANRTTLARNGGDGAQGILIIEY